MSNKPITMSKLKSIIYKLSKGSSNKSISKQFGISRNTVLSYKKKIEELNMDYDELLGLSDEEIFNLLQNTNGDKIEENRRYQYLLDQMDYYIEELKRPGVTRLLL